MTRRPERVDFDAAQRELRRLLDAWDPIGVYSGEPPHAPPGEYDCLFPQV